MAANLDRAETSLTAVSDIAYVRAIDSSGNSVRISKADLASVLGGIKTILTTSDNLNDIKTQGVYVWSNSGVAGGLPSSYPTSNGSGVLNVINGNESSIQYLKSRNGSMWKRGWNHVNSVWGPWVRDDNFGCETLAELKAALNAV